MKFYEKIGTKFVLACAVFLIGTFLKYHDKIGDWIWLLTSLLPLISYQLFNTIITLVLKKYESVGFTIVNNDQTAVDDDQNITTKKQAGFIGDENGTM